MQYLDICQLVNNHYRGNMIKYLKQVTISICLLFCANSPILASSINQGVDDFAHNLIDRTFAILNDNNMLDADKNSASKALLEETLDYEWMGNFVLGSHKRTVSPEQKGKFLEAYRDFVLSYFTKNFANLKGASFVLKASKEIGEGEYSVDCECTKPGSGEKIDIQIMVRSKEGKFLVFDLTMAGVSFISSQRSEYNATISDKGIDFMTDYLKSMDKVSQFEQKNNVEVYTADYCPYCKTAKEFLKQHNIRFNEIDVTNNPQARQKIAEESSIKTVPQIFVNGKFVSDCSGLFEIKKEGKIAQVFFGS